MQNLDEIKKVLSLFEQTLEKKQQFYKSARAQNPGFGPLSEESCQKELARCWIYGIDHIGTLFKEPLPKISHQPALSQSLAFGHYNKWLKALKKNAVPDSEYIEYFLNDEYFSDYHLDEPKKDETLYNYVIRLQELIEKKEKIHFLWERGLSSFLHYLRKSHSKDQIAFLELIFPGEMEIKKGTTTQWIQLGKSMWKPKEVPFGQIARKISPPVYPIFIITAADVLRELANTVLYGRKNAQLVSAEALGLCWICLTHARLRLPVELKSLITIPRSVLKKPSEETLPVISLPTLFGHLPMPASETIWNFLKALSNTKESLFQSPKESLYRCLRRTIERLNLDPKKGKITFQTFLSQPVEFDHRYQPR